MTFFIELEKNPKIYMELQIHTTIYQKKLPNQSQAKRTKQETLHHLISKYTTKL
jgi:hypothetical protein